MAYTLLPDDAKAPAESKGAKGKYTLLPEDSMGKVDPTGSFVENVAAGAGKAIVDTGRGLRQIASYVPGLNRLEAFDPAKVNAEVDEAKQRDAALMGTTGGLIGNIGANLAAAVLVPGGKTKLASAAIGAGLGAVQPVASDESRASNIAIGGAAGAAGKYVGDKVAGALTGQLANAEATGAARATANQVKDAALTAAKQAGYVVPPSSANPTRLNQALEGISGKIKTAQVASDRNQAVTNELAKKALGLADDQPLTIDTLNAVRREAGKAYEAVRGTGTVAPDEGFTKALDGLAAKYAGAAKDFPKAVKSEVTDMLDSLRVPKFDADSAVDMIKILRDDADAAYRAGKNGLGKAAKGAADAIEAQLERHIERLEGPGPALQAFREARQQIAKTYSVQKALNETTGNVDARKLGALLERGKPLSGELRTAGEFGRAFPKAAQTLKEAPGALSPLDFGAAFLSGNPVALAVRPAVRNMLLSAPYQAAMTTPNYAPGMVNRLAASGGPALGAGLPGLTTLGALQFTQ